MRCITGGVAILVAAAAALGEPVHLEFSQDFETGTAGLTPFVGGAINRVPSGAGGIAAPQGQFYGRGLLNSDNGTTPGGGGGSGFRATVPFSGQIGPTFVATQLRESVRIFLDPSAGAVGDSWFCTTTHERQRGFWFEKTGAGQMDVITTFDGGPISFGTHTSVSSAGWYTFENSFTATTTPSVFDVNYLIRGPQGNELLNLGGTTTIGGSPAAPAFFNWVVGWDNGGDQNIAVDAVQFTLDGFAPVVIPLPGAAGMAMVGFGVVGGWRRRGR